MNSTHYSLSCDFSYNIRALPVTLTKTLQSEVSDSVDAEAGAKAEVLFD